MTHSTAPTDPLLTGLGWQTFFADQLQPGEEDLQPLRIATLHRARMTAHGPAGPVRLELPPKTNTSDYAVGDWVLAEPDTALLRRRLERKTLLQRRTEGGTHPQLIAANVDTLFIVTSCNADLNIARLERYLALANEAGTTPVLVLTKADTVEDAAEWRAQVTDLQRGLQVVSLNAKSEEARATLAPWCGAGQTVALVGSSGVGKSSLLNTLADKAEEDRQETGGIREDDAKGRHTTTARSLHAMVTGGQAIDTPGIRTLHVSDISVGFDVVFAEISELAPDCRFRNCTHAHEPGCAVQAGVAAGTVSAARLERWQKLQAENTFNTPVEAGARGNKSPVPRGGRRR